jgi:hypothetical protein
MHRNHPIRLWQIKLKRNVLQPPVVVLKLQGNRNCHYKVVKLHRLRKSLRFFQKEQDHKVFCSRKLRLNLLVLGKYHHANGNRFRCVSMMR